MIHFAQFPRLTPTNHRITSPPSIHYNCIAWAIGDTSIWWQPGLHWPFPTHPLDDTVEELKRAFATVGYAECAAGDLELGFEKVALFGTFGQYTHAARQLKNGQWTSKLGTEEDIEHDAVELVGGGIYGDVALFMKRQLSNPT
jgi:hypothetical protein